MSIEQDLRILFDDIKACAEGIAQDPKTYFGQFRLIPPVLPAGGGRLIYMSQTGADAVVRISRSIRSNSRQLKAAMSEGDMEELTSKSIGELIACKSGAPATEFPLPEDTAAFKGLLRRRIESKLAELQLDCTHLFGAWVFEGTGIRPVDIGPVRFSPREVWLQDAIRSGLLTKGQGTRISKRWQDARVRRRTNGDNADLMEANVIETIGPCP